MIAKPIVNGFEKEMAGKVEVVHLNLTSKAGREVSGRYGVRMVPASLLFNSKGELVARVDGVPKKDALIGRIQNPEETNA